jgi:hypothetical protein
VDTIAYWDLKTAFCFARDEQDVEVTNAGTKGPVVADAVRFLSTDGKGKTVVIDDPEAEGHEKWQTFNPGQFKPYNITGKGRSAITARRRRPSRSATYRRRWSVGTDPRTTVLGSASRARRGMKRGRRSWCGQRPRRRSSGSRLPGMPTPGPR